MNIVENENKRTLFTEEELRVRIFDLVLELTQERKISWDFTNSRIPFFDSAIKGKYEGLSFGSYDVQGEGCLFEVSLKMEDGARDFVHFGRRRSEEMRSFLIDWYRKDLAQKVQENPDFYRALREKKDAEKEAEEARRKEQERKEQERDLEILLKVVSLFSSEGI